MRKRTNEIKSITSFTDQNEYLSNFFESPVIYNHVLYRSPEHAFQATKALKREDHDAIKNAETPREARRIGRLVLARIDWEEIKIEVMEEILVNKFENRPDLKQRLVDTAPLQLVEGNTWNDRFWGAEQVEGRWFGENNLGKLLMKLRDRFISEASSQSN